MLGNLSYIKLLVSGGVIVVAGLMWLMLIHGKPGTDQAAIQGIERISETSVDTQERAMQVESHKLSAEQASLRAQLDILQKTLHTHIQESAAVLQERSSSTETDNAYAVQENITDRELSVRVTRADWAQQEDIVSQIETEVIDPTWASWAEDKLMMAFETAEDVDASRFNTICRSTFCRVEGEFGDVDAREQAIVDMMVLVPWQAQAFYQSREEGGTIGALYIMREGETGLNENELGRTTPSN